MRNTDPDKMALSSADETKGIQPINRAVELVRLMLRTDFLEEHGSQPEGDDLPVIYVVSFTYILGGWKAMLSTSEANGHYYEVTYNVAKLETYIDRYSKDYNEFVPDAPVKERANVTVEQAVNSGTVHITPAPTSAREYMEAEVGARRRRSARQGY